MKIHAYVYIIVNMYIYSRLIRSFIAVLTLYFLHYLHFDQKVAKELYHGSSMLAYTTPLMGSILADGYIGKFWWVYFFYKFLNHLKSSSSKKRKNQSVVTIGLRKEATEYWKIKIFFISGPRKVTIDNEIFFYIQGGPIYGPPCI